MGIVFEQPGNSTRVTSHPRYAYIDSLRAIMALWVVLGHTVSSDLVLSLPLAFQFLRWIHYDRLAVTSFIVISGYCLMLPVAKSGKVGNVFRFFERRWFRILPVYYASLGLCLLIDGACNRMHPRGGYMRSLLAHLWIQQDLVDEPAAMFFHAVTWTIAVEWHIYLFFPLLAYFMLKLGPRVALYATIMAYMVQARFSNSNLAAHYYGLFTFGMAAAVVALKPDCLRFGILRRIPIVPIFAAAVALFIVLMFVIGIDLYVEYLPYIDCPWALLTAIGLVIVPNTPSLNQVLSWRPLAFIGSFSYSIYVTHSIFFFGMLYLFRNSTNTALVAMLATWVVVLPAAYLFHLCFERPFMRKAAVSKEKAISETESLETPVPKIV